MQNEKFSRAVTAATLGFAVGDALGVPAEFMSRAQLSCCPVTDMRGGGVHAQPAGTWSDDTSMTLCVMDSLTRSGFNCDDQMQRFSDWLTHAAYTAHGEVFDVGHTTRITVRRHKCGVPAAKCGERSEHSCGNGSLMRILPVAFYLLRASAEAVLDDRSAEIIHAASACTHAHPRCLMACGIYASVVFQLYRGGELAEIVYNGIRSALDYYRCQAEFAPFCGEFTSLLTIDQWPEEKLCGSGYVLHTLQASIGCLLTTPDYAGCVLKAIRLGDDTDTTAAVAGGLAGLRYGRESIPQRWQNQLAGAKEIEALCLRFAEACTQSAPA